MWLGSMYEGNPRDWVAFDTAAQAKSWEAAYPNSVVWRSGPVDPFEALSEDAAQQLEIGLAFVADLVASTRAALGLAP